MTMMIETRELYKAFGDQVVLEGIDLDVAAGTIFALLVPTALARPRRFRFYPR